MLKAVRLRERVSMGYENKNEQLKALVNKGWRILGIIPDGCRQIAVLEKNKK